MYSIELPKFPSDCFSKVPNILKEKITHQYIFIKPDSIKEDIKTIFSECDLVIKYILVFMKPKNTIGGIHSDVYFDTSTNTKIHWETALNINLTENNTDSVMYWFKSNVPGVSPYTSNPPIFSGIHYGYYGNGNFRNTKDFDLLHKMTIVHPTLVKTNVPHLVENTGLEPRMALSFRFEGNPTIEECAKKLEKFI